MKVIKGDLVKLATMGEFDVIVHGANCFCCMGAGIAKQISFTFPEALKADKMTNFGSRDKLGEISIAAFPINDEGATLTVVNAYTQFGTWKKGDDAIPLDYTAVHRSFQKIKDKFGGMDLRFGIPKIGAGLAGGDWNVISKIIDDIMEGEDITLVEYEAH